MGFWSLKFGFRQVGNTIRALEFHFPAGLKYNSYTRISFSGRSKMQFVSSNLIFRLVLSTICALESYFQAGRK